MKVLAEKYCLKLETPTVQDFLLLRRKIGWGDLAANLAEKSLNSSLFHVIIYYDGQLIGMGRVVGDGAMYFYIQDVIVDPSYQSQGLGTVLMDTIEGYLRYTAQKGSTIGLLSAAGRESFYARYGYIQRPSDSTGHGMCRFV
ncbi:GNAT family N-acetyltransferase [Colwellia sp. 75C3]|uniref:GNAT family N-acetyltransferase n=1 Tax=Colwellia sp. 75C3 TaxID=888425 RepID=UPI000C31E6EF|nr:GNAT family N-acetyltransferase [Colwellia sp. 75C3]PKG81408.1 GNAT family N-acetyltransferase [Colwellia sp. 75C3]